MLVSSFHFDLPHELIAQHPPAVRGSSRMLSVSRSNGDLHDDTFLNLPAHLRPGDLLILNDSRVLPARLFASRHGHSGRIEVLLTKRLAPHTWSALVRPSRKVPMGQRLLFPDSTGSEVLSATVLDAGEFGERTLEFAPDPHFLDHVDAIGHMPLPPYIHRVKAERDSVEDRSRYQTVYAGEAGSAAAPTAGLHFTPEILLDLRAKGVQVESVTLHVGLGTFQPVRVQQVDEIRLHTEHYTLPAATAAAVTAAMSEGRRIIAAGTTTARTLEHCAAIGRLEPHTGSTDIFLAPGCTFRAISGLLTNFHLPESTLLMLVSAFLSSDREQGRQRSLAAYRHAVDARYRFFSYGDCMLIL